MRHAWSITVVAMVLFALSDSAAQVNKSSKQAAVITHDATAARVSADATRPLKESAQAIALEYGLLVDYEDPGYQSSYDRADDTDPTWRAAHPSEPDVTTIAGKHFESEFTPITDAKNAGQLKASFSKLLTDYNGSANPGHFKLITNTAGRVSIIGDGIRDDKGLVIPTNPILDSPVTLTGTEGNIYLALMSVMKQVSSQTGFKMNPGTLPLNLVMQSQSTARGQQISARDAIIRIMDSSSKKLIYALLYDPDTKTYYLSMTIAAKATIGPYGVKKFQEVH